MRKQRSQEMLAAPIPRVIETTLDHVYFIVLPNKAGICYTPPAPSAREAWDNFAKFAMWDGMTPESARRQGYRAKRCKVSLLVQR